MWDMEKQTILTESEGIRFHLKPRDEAHRAARFLAECIWLNTGALEGRMGDGAEKAAVTGQNGDTGVWCGYGCECVVCVWGVYECVCRCGV